VAEVRLWINPRKDVIGGLPRVCMKCGAPATTSKVVQFAWYPPLLLALIPVGLLPFVLVVMVLTKRQRVKVPLCHEHENHFFLIRVLRALGYFGFFGAPVLFVVGIVVNEKGNLASYLCVGWIILILLYFAAVRVFALLTKIRPTEITDRSVTLTNVAEHFVSAMEEDDDEEDEIEDLPPERRPPRRRADDDRYQSSERPPPKRSTDVTGEEPD
jgi:hypothetical protein